MSYFSKEVYEKKQEYADKKNATESKTAIENGMAEDQAEAITELCSIRHWLHCNQESLWIEESSDRQKYENYLASGISELLDGAGLDSLAWDTDDLETDETFNFNDETGDYDLYEVGSEEYQAAYDDNRRDVLSFCEKVNQDIENYLRKIDEKYGTHYCPTGYARSQC